MRHQRFWRFFCDCKPEARRLFLLSRRLAEACFGASRRRRRKKGEALAIASGFIWFLSEDFVCEISLHDFQTYRFGLQNGLFHRLKRAVSQSKTGCFATQNGIFCKSLVIRRLQWNYRNGRLLKYFYIPILIPIGHENSCEWACRV